MQGLYPDAGYETFALPIFKENNNENNSDFFD